MYPAPFILLFGNSRLYEENIDYLRMADIMLELEQEIRSIEEALGE